jgi:hypothetical protein
VARELPRRPLTDRELLVGWLVRAVAACIIFGGVTAIGRGEPFTVRNVVGYGLLFGVLVATLHFLMALYQRHRAGRR